MSATAPSGAYWRIIALMLIFLAAFRYFSDSERNDVDRWDIPNNADTPITVSEKGTNG